MMKMIRKMVMKKTWAPNVKQIYDILRLYTRSAMVVSPFKHWMWKRGGSFLLATDQNGVNAGMICFITIYGVQVLAFETMASTIQDPWLQVL